MSADRQRLTSAIRRIAKTDPEIRGLLKAADNKGGKPGAAGVGSSTEAKQARVCCGGSTSDNANPGTETRDPTDGDQDGLDPNDPADLSGLDGGCLKGVTNCDTGESVCFCGDDWLPPDGWDDPNEPPLLEGYEEGVYYETTLGVTGVTPCAAVKKTYPKLGAYNTEYYQSGASVGRCCDHVVRSEGNDGSISYYDRETCTTKRLCSEADDPACDEDGYADIWPEDNCVNLAIKTSAIVGSKYDPENDGSYSAPRSSIDLCDGNGNQISLAPAANGGWKTINSTNDSGYLYDSKGKVIAHIDGNEYSDPSV